MSPIQLLRYSICTMMLCVAYTYALARFSGKKATLLEYLACVVLNLLLQLANIFLIGAHVGLQPVLTMAVMAIVGYFGYSMRGFDLVISLLILLICCIVSDTAAGYTMIAIFGIDRVNVMAAEFSALNYLMTMICTLLIICTTTICDRLRFRLLRIDVENAARVGRSAVMLIIILYLFYRIIEKATFEDRAQHIDEMLPQFVSLTVLLFICLTYIIQDIRYVRQRRMNRALLEQKQIQDAMLQDTRVFRHNIANLLYGFRGTVMSGDAANIREYYERMTAICRIINNENVVALQRIPSVPLHTLLMEKIQAANGRGIPFYVYTDADLIWRGLRDSEMCEALGVLLDNALEAAGESAAPLVTVELHNAGPDMETAVRNTCRDVERALAQPGKAGHEGLGLMSLKKLLDKHPNAVFNLYTRGRFVEAQLLLRGQG